MQTELINISSKAFEELIEDMEVESFPEEEKNQLLSKLSEVVTNKVFVEVMERIGEEGRIEYEKALLENQTPDELKMFFFSKIDDFDNLVADVIDKLRIEMFSNGK